MWQYLKSREFRRTFLILILLSATLFVVFFFVFLPLITRHGSYAVVPDVSKMVQSEAVEVIEGQGLEAVISDSLFVATLNPLEIISQDPSGGDTVKPGRKIYLTVNKAVPPMVKIPDILNVSLYQAKLRLESWNLKVGALKFKPHPYRNLVLGAVVAGKKVEPGDSIAVGTEVDLFVGEGKGSTNIEVPKLVGLHYSNAISLMHQLGLNIGSIKFDPNAGGDPGTVFEQYPRFSPGDSIHLGEQVTLFIAGPEPEQAIEGLDGLLDELDDKGEPNPGTDEDNR